ncbi:MAG: hypothetical protein NW217_00200 [Hyphomicrobiaceae bacterium]|nr:hypothetical protein [Hyphomicrobiaceae bacterium]
MPKGRVHTALRDALNTLKDRQPNWTTYRIHKEIADNPEKYDAPASFSPTVVANAIGGKAITPRTRDILTGFVRRQDASLLPPDLPKVDLDIAGFFYTRGAKLDKAGEAVRGHFQTFAKSTTVEGYVRRGKMIFEYDAKKWRLQVRECQVRPKIGSHPSHTMRWHGFATQRNEVYYGLLRTETDEQDATPLFYAMRPMLRDHATGRIKSMVAYAMHFEPERRYFTFPTVFLQRVDDEPILEDFVPESEITDPALRTWIGLPQLKPARRSARKLRPPSASISPEA